MNMRNMLNNSKTLQASIFVIFLLLFISVFSFASSITPPTLSLNEALKNLADRSSIVVAGTVTDMSSKYAPDTETTLPSRYPYILTDVSIKPISFFKGKMQEFLTVVIPGGCIREDNICFSTDFAPTFMIGEQIILFLNAGEDGTWILSDYFYSKQLYSGEKSLAELFDETVIQESLPSEELSNNETNGGLTPPSAVSGGCSLLPL